jgi:Sec-independent protein translocase protein TatA
VNGFFGIGTGELFAIIVIAILVVGPKRMLEFGQAIGRLTRRGRQIWGEVMNTIQAELQETQTVMQEISSEATSLTSEVESTGETAQAAVKKSGTSVTDVQTELKTFGQEAQQVMKEVTEGFTDLVMGNEEEKKDQKVNEKEEASPEAESTGETAQATIGKGGTNVTDVQTELKTFGQEAQ